MTVEEAKTALFDAATLRVPSFEERTSAGIKISGLEDWGYEAAIKRGDLEEARLWVSEVLHRFTLDWTQLEGWDVNLPGGKRRKDATRDDITDAKRQANPELFVNISDMKHLLSALGDQIRRIEKDEERVSRQYTFITGS